MVSLKISRRTHINDTTQRPNGIWPVDRICSSTSILHDCTCDHNNILCGMRQFLNDKVDHLPQAGIFILEQLRDTKEKGSGFVGREFLAGV